MNPSIANSLNPVIPSAEALKWHEVFKSVSIFGDGDIPIKRESGVKRLVLLSFFRGEVERRVQPGNSACVIYAVPDEEHDIESEISSVKDSLRDKTAEVAKIEATREHPVKVKDAPVIS